MKLSRFRYSFAAIGCFPAHFPVRIELQKSAKQVTEGRMIIDYQNALM